MNKGVRNLFGLIGSLVLIGADSLFIVEPLSQLPAFGELLVKVTPFLSSVGALGTLWFAIQLIICNFHIEVLWDK